MKKKIYRKYEVGGWGSSKFSQVPRAMWSEELGIFPSPNVSGNMKKYEDT